MKDPETRKIEIDPVVGDPFTRAVVDSMTWGQRDENILDYGCGMGRIGVYLLLPKVSLFDSRIFSVSNSKHIIELAKQKNPCPRILTYAVGNLFTKSFKDFPFRGIFFEKIFVFYVVNFIQHYDDLLKKFYKLLKPGGQLGFTFLSQSLVFLLHQMMTTNNRWAQFIPENHGSTPKWLQDNENPEESIRNTLTATGFEIVRIDTKVVKHSFNNVEEIIDLFMSVNPFKRFIPKELHVQIANDYREFICNYKKIEPGSRIEDTYEILYSVARKPIDD